MYDFQYELRANFPDILGPLRGANNFKFNFSTRKQIMFHAWPCMNTDYVDIFWSREQFESLEALKHKSTGGHMRFVISCSYPGNMKMDLPLPAAGGSSANRIPVAVCQ